MHKASPMNLQGSVHQDHHDHSSEWAAPVVAHHETMERHGLSCAPFGGDGCVPDEGNPPLMGEALVRPELNSETLRQERVAERPDNLGDHDKEDSRVQCAHSEESGDQWQSDDMSTF